MKREKIYLNYYQIKALIFEIKKLQFLDSEFNDGVALTFLNAYSKILKVNREVCGTSKLIFIKDLSLYSVGVWVYNYLTSLIGIDVVSEDITFYKNLDEDINAFLLDIENNKKKDIKVKCKNNFKK